MKIVDLKRFRRDNKLTQMDLANLFGCKQNFISQIESGQKQFPPDKVDILTAKYGDISGYITEKEDTILQGISPQELMETGADAFTKQIIKMMNDHLIAPYSMVLDKDKEIERLNRLIGSLETQIKNSQK
jgi:predicted transcriptional regulator